MVDLLAGNIEGGRLSSTGKITVPDAQHPAVTDADGEQLRQTDRSIEPGKAAPLGGKRWKALSTVAETITVNDDSGDSMTIELTYRLEQRPAEIGEVPDVWIHTERRALLTLGTGEHAGATIIGQARIRIGADEVLDPRAAIARPSIGPGHSAQVYLEASEQFVNVFGPGGRKSLQADATGTDLLVYDDPLRMMMALKRILKQQHIAGMGAAVARQHAEAKKLLEAAQLSKAVIEAHIKAVKSHHDGTPGKLVPIRWLLGDIANWLAANDRQGREDTDEADKLRAVHRQLLERLEQADAARPPERSVAEDVLGIPVRFIERTGEGLKEVGLMALDAFMLGIVRPIEMGGGSDFDYQPRSKYGQWVNDTGASATDGLVAMVNGLADQWSDAIERARNGDYSGVMDVGLDTALFVEGARSTAANAIAKAPQVIAKGAELVAKVRGVATKARALAGRVPAEVGDIAAAMAEAAEAFVAKQRAPGMQTSTPGGPDGPAVPGGLDVTPQSLAAGIDSAKSVYAAKRASQAKDRGVATIKQRLGGAANAPDAAEWVTRVEVALGGDQNALVKFLGDMGKRVTDPAPLMRAVDSLLGSMKVAPDDLAVVLRKVLSAEHADPVALLREIEWVTTRTLSAESRSMLIRKAAKGSVDLEWVRRSKLTDTELEILGHDSYTDWSGFGKLSDMPGRKTPGRLADRPPKPEEVGTVNAKIRGIAAELAAAEIELPNGLKVRRRVASDSKSSSTDYEVAAADGSLAELEVKGHSPKNWKPMLDEYEAHLQQPTAKPGQGASQISRLVEQVEAGRARGRKVYVAISDATPLQARERLLAVLEPSGVKPDQLILLSESEIKRIGKQLREHMGIPQPGGRTPSGGDVE